MTSISYAVRYQLEEFVRPFKIFEVSFFRTKLDLRYRVVKYNSVKV